MPRPGMRRDRHRSESVRGGLWIRRSTLRPRFSRRRPLRGPWGAPWCCWPLLCTFLFVVLASIGISLLQMVVGCSENVNIIHLTVQSDSAGHSTDDCTEYEAIFVAALAALMCCSCCCSLISRDEGYVYDYEVTEEEREPILVQDSVPPVVFAEAAPVYATVTTGVAPATATRATVISTGV